MERRGRELADSKVAVAVVSFGVVEGADKWLADTGCKYPMFLDPERKLYRKFGLHRSLAKEKTIAIDLLLRNMPSFAFVAFIESV